MVVAIKGHACMCLYARLRVCVRGRIEIEPLRHFNVSSPSRTSERPALPVDLCFLPQPTRLCSKIQHPSFNSSLSTTMSSRSGVSLMERFYASSLSYKTFLIVWATAIHTFFREIRPRGAFNIPRDGPVIFVAAPHHNQVRCHVLPI